jgi:2-dehydropantoate 2-reductase
VGILGPGGVGGLLAGTLARQGADVTCVATPATAQTIFAQGISITSERFGTFHEKVTAVPILNIPVDVLCVTVKATALVESFDRIPSNMLQGRLVIPFLNGVEHLGILRDHFPLARVVAATIRIESARLSAGEIIQKSPFAAITFAPRPTETDGLSDFGDLLTQAGFDVAISTDENAILWQKLSFLAPLALMTTAHNMPAGVIRTEHRPELIAVIDEVAAVALAEGVDVDTSKILAQFDSVPETMQSSMQRDATAGQPIEIEAIGGSVLRSAEVFSIELPTVHRLVTQLRDIPTDPT